jgi:soluble lytic murein transglycosylase-like protein
MRLPIKLGLLLAIIAPNILATDLAVLQNGSSIRHERREVMGASTRLYTGAGNEQYVDIPTAQIDHFELDPTPAVVTPAAAPGATRSAAAFNLNDAVNTASDRTRIDPDLIRSVIHAESGFNPNAVSPKGAQGLMQLMPQTASKLGVANAMDPGANVDGGTRYLRELLERYNFDLVKALAAYNAGPQRVEQYHGVPPYSETRAYVAHIVRDFNRQKLAERRAAKLNAKTTVKKQPKPLQASVAAPETPTTRSNPVF